jgi:UDP-N-acetylglucosamine 2-epimerase (non-hydrolysing)
MNLSSGSSANVSRRVLVPFGTRPEIVKLAPVVRALRDQGHQVFTVDTGQHTSSVMSAEIASALGLAVDVSNVLTSDADERVGQILADAIRLVREHRPDLVLALGDTQTVPAYVLAARRNSVPFAHLEAGLRSFNERSVEELNRRVASAGSSIHFAPTERARSFLLREGVASERIFVVGNSAIDSLVASGLRRVPCEEREGVIVTAHRPTNVDDPVRLRRLTSLINDLSYHVAPVLFPVHPRTEQRLEAGGANASPSKDVVRCPPLGYFDFIDRLRHARLVITDSGGVQEEAAYFGVPVVILRGSTPRWEGVENGSAVLVSLAHDQGVADALTVARHFVTRESQSRIANLPCPYGDGTTGPRVAEILSRSVTEALLTLQEPDFTNGTLPW